MNETKNVPEERCPACGNVMRVVRVVPRVAGHAELRSFKCATCGEIITKPVEPNG